MRSAAFIVAGLLSATSVAPAAADWQYTQWGMSAAQVKAASEGVAQDNRDRTLDPAGMTATLIAPFQGEALSFTAVFLFDAADRLTTVTLNPVEGVACPAIVDALDATYGKPEGRADMGQATTMRWNDLDDDDRVVFLDLGQGNCTVQYSKLPPTRPSGKGL